MTPPTLTSTCRSCGAPIIWAHTPNGKSMPLDAEPDPTGNIVLDDGTARVEPNQTLTGTRHTSHFATCPHAETWRKR